MQTPFHVEEALGISNEISLGFLSTSFVEETQICICLDASHFMCANALCEFSARLILKSKGDDKALCGKTSEILARVGVVALGIKWSPGIPVSLFIVPGIESCIQFQSSFLLMHIRSSR